MRQPQQQRPQHLAVQVSFEVTRLANDYLADAYEQIVPLLHRITGATAQPQTRAGAVVGRPREELAA